MMIEIDLRISSWYYNVQDSLCETRRRKVCVRLGGVKNRVFSTKKKSFAFSSNVGCEGIKGVKMFASNLYL